MSGSPACADDFRKHAQELLPPDVWDYFMGGAGGESTVLANREAFGNVALIPRVLVDVGRRDLRTRVLGTDVHAPIGIAPIAHQRLAHADGEAGTARAAGAEGLLCVVPTFSSQSLEEVAEAVTGPLWFQLYCLRDRSVTKELVDRAQVAGYRALVLTVDAPVLGYRDRDIRNAFRLPGHAAPANFRTVTAPRADGPQTAELSVLNKAMVDPSVSWRDVEWLRGLTDLPIVLKGILSSEDAARAASIGVEGILVSNHGGRQVDGAVASLGALPGVLGAVDGRCEVYFDGGVRRGSDVVKALAIGARMVFLGRPVLWGLAVGGEAGVRDVLRCCKEDLDRTMAGCGCADIASIHSRLVRLRPRQMRSLDDLQ